MSRPTFKDKIDDLIKKCPILKKFFLGTCIQLLGSLLVWLIVFTYVSL